MEIFPGISMDPGIRFGKPCLTGTRIDVATVMGALAAGESIERCRTPMPSRANKSFRASICDTCC